MRQIKFRAWDKDAEIMFRDGDDCDGYPYDIVFNQDGSITAQTYIDGGVFSEEGGEVVEHGGTIQIDAVVMQYTGLKDKNGVEIYESDIVRTYHPFSKFDYNDEKDFIDGEWQCVWEAPAFTFLPTDGRTGLKMSKLGGELAEVIGNIYENPELLKP